MSIPFAVVLDGDDVAALLRDERQQLDQLARAVGRLRAHDEVAARGGQPVAHDRRSAASGRCCRRRARRSPARAADLPGEQRRDADRARALDDELRALEQQHDRLADLLVRDRDDVVEQIRRGAASCSSPGCFDRDPVGDRVAVPTPGLHADDVARPAAARAARSRCRAASPPPPIGIEQRARRPAPARRARARSSPGPRSTSSVLEGMDERRRRSPRRSASAAAIASSKTRAAHLRLARRSCGIASTFAIGASCGTKIVARDAEPRAPPTRRPARGCRRWPRRRPPRAPPRRSVASLLTAPRILNDAGALEVLRLQAHLAPAAARERLRAVDRRHSRDAPRGAAAPPRCQRASVRSVVAKLEHLLHDLAHRGQRIELAPLHLVEQAPQLRIVRHRLLEMRLRAARMRRRRPRRRGSCALRSSSCAVRLEVRAMLLDLLPQLRDVLAAWSPR